jgi:hypothetical protein
MQREVISGHFSFPLSEAKQVLNFLAEYSYEAPDEMQVDPYLASFPGMPAPMVGVSLVWSGDQGKAEKLFAPLRGIGTVINEKVVPVDYVALQRSGDVNDVRANGSYMKGGFVGKISPELVETLVDNFETHPARSTWMAFQQSGGAVGRIANEDTAFAYREAESNMLSFVGWKHGDDPTEHINYIKSHWSTVEGFTHGFYSNDEFDQTQAQVNTNYRGNFERLLKIKQQYDPTNLFRLNANIRTV